MAQPQQSGELNTLVQLANDRHSLPTQNQMVEQVSRLQQEYLAACQKLNETEKHGGVLSWLVDGAKNHLGSNPQSPHYWSSLWGEFLDRTKGSKAIEAEARRDQAALNELQKNVTLDQPGEFLKNYKALTGSDFDLNRPASGNLALPEKVGFYSRSQERMVDSLVDGCSALAATLAQWKFRQSTIAPVAFASATKVLLKATEPSYRHPLRDAATGAVDGLAIVLADRLGRRTISAMGQPPAGRLAYLHFAGRAAAVEGVGGSIFGAVTGPIREYFSAKDSNTPLSAHDLGHAAWRDAKTGFVLGLPFSFR